MEFQSEIHATFENGVFKPDERVRLPERARVVLSVRSERPTPEEAREAQRVIGEIACRGSLRMKGSTP
jgi:predicted DNA-binding antitoxin AbrB/MazE fold protein